MAVVVVVLLVLLVAYHSLLSVGIGRSTVLPKKCPPPLNFHPPLPRRRKRKRNMPVIVRWVLIY